jgi:hypothetical protein
MADLGYFTAGITFTPALGAGPATDLELGAQDANGTWWLLKSWDGMGGVATVGQTVQKAGDHGAFATPQWYGPRTLTLTVQATARTQALRDVARAFLQQAIPVGSDSNLATLRWDEPVPVQLAVRRSGPIVETYTTLVDAVFSVPLVAPDPRKYSTVLHQATATQAAAAAGLAPPLTPPLTLPAGAPAMAVSCTNAGSFETRPIVSITGPITAPAVVNQTTGQVVSFSGMTLAATDVLAVDFLGKSALLNGVYRPADVSSSWWLMPPGTTGIRVTGTGSTGSTMTVAWRDAWI